MSRDTFGTERVLLYIRLRGIPCPLVGRILTADGESAGPAGPRPTDRVGFLGQQGAARVLGLRLPGARLAGRPVGALRVHLWFGRVELGQVALVVRLRTGGTGSG